MRRTIFEDVHDDFRDSVRQFLLKEAVPHSERWEEAGIVERDFWRKAAAQGLVAFAAPEHLGGAGIDDFRFNAIIDEEVETTGAVGDNLSLCNDIVAPYLLELANEEQQERWLPGLTAGERVWAIAMSEPGAGSDLRGIQSTARHQGDHWVLNGSKTFVTSGIQADDVIVVAQVRNAGVDGLGLFAVAAEAHGFSRGRKLSKAGHKAQDTAELFFDDVVVPERDVIGVAGRGLDHLKANLAQERLSMAVTGVAASERAFRLTLEYVAERRAFGRRLADFQATRFTLAELHTELEVGRAYVDRCVEAHAARELTAVEAAAAKLWATELQSRVTDRCLQLFGGYGYMDEYEISRLWRDARVTRIYGGTSEIMKEIVGRAITR